MQVVSWRTCQYSSADRPEGNVELLGGIQEGDKILMPTTTTLPVIASQSAPATHP